MLEAVAPPFCAPPPEEFPPVLVLPPADNPPPPLGLLVLELEQATTRLANAASETDLVGFIMSCRSNMDAKNATLLVDRFWSAGPGIQGINLVRRPRVPLTV